jgi:DUF4097 and DUF4098 domain-containing protein YvlB
MRACLLLLNLLIASSLFPQEAAITAMRDPEAPYVEREEKQFQFYPGGKIQILCEVPGNVRIIGWKKGIVRVEAEKLAFSLSPEKAEAAMTQLPIHVRYNQTSAKIQVEGTPADGAVIEYNLTVFVPGDKTDINTTISQGDVFVGSVNGWIEVTTGQGNLEISALSGYFSGSTDKGDIRVEMSGRRWRGLECGAMTRMGSIDLQLPGDYSAGLKLETLNGNVTVDYPPRIVDGEPVPLSVGIRKKAQALDASVGDGGSPVKLISRLGDIRLSLKE